MTIEAKIRLVLSIILIVFIWLGNEFCIKLSLTLIFLAVEFQVQLNKNIPKKTRKSFIGDKEGGKWV